MKNTVPFFSLTQQWAAVKPTIMPKLEALLDAQMCIGGAAVTDFESAFSNYTGATHAIGCSSGTSALWLALRALNLKPNSIVLTTPFSFVASASEIYEHGAHPVFIDTDPKTHNMCPQALIAWLEQNTTQENGQTIETSTGYPVVGMVIVNIFGLAADFTEFNTLKKQYDLWIVEDAAQSIGARHDGRASGTLGDISTFSFYPTKNLSAAGDAGAITTSNDQLAERLRQLRNHGRHSHYEYQGYGTNARLDALQAVILQEKLHIIDQLLARRRAIAARYTAAFTELPGITVPFDDSTHTYHQYTLTVDEHIAACSRDELSARLTTTGVGNRVYYPELLTDIAYLQTDSRLYTQCPSAQKSITCVLSLPIWPELSDEAVDTVISAFKASILPTYHTTSLPRDHA